MTPARRAAWSLVIAGIFLPSTRLSAHQVTPEHVVEMYLRPESGRLTVLLRMPTTALIEASLPRLANGTLDVPALEERLQVIAAGVADNLEIKQGGVTLERPTARARISPLADRSFITFPDALRRIEAAPSESDRVTSEPDVFVDFALGYIAQAEGSFSLRVNPFRAQGEPVRTIAHYVMASGEQTANVKGPIERITFNPEWAEVVKQFALRGLQSLLVEWDSLLLLGCLVVPVRRARTVAGLVALVAVGQIAGAGIVAIASAPPQTVVTVQAIAASAIVVASIQNVAGAPLQWVRALALGFGVLYGFSQGNQLNAARPFAGGHAALAAVVFMSVAVFAQSWTVTLLWFIRRWLEELGLPERIATIGLSGLIAHSALHRVIERTQPVASGFDGLLTQLTIGWAVVILVVAVIEAFKTRARLAHMPPTRADA